MNGSGRKEHALFRKLRYEGLTRFFVMMRVMFQEDCSPLIAAASPRTALLSPQDYFGENQNLTGEAPSLRPVWNRAYNPALA